MLFFLIASIIASSLTGRFQRQLLISKRNEQTAKNLYEVVQSFLKVTGQSNIAYHGINYIKEHTEYDSVIELGESKAVYKSETSHPDDYLITELPVMGHTRKIGILRLYSKEEAILSKEEEWLVHAVIVQMGIALDREFLYNEREKIRIDMEREHLKSNLLRSISHDLRTPLTGIVGASSYIVQRSRTLNRENIRHLAEDISDQAVWLTDLVENILNMTRIDNGNLDINKQVEVIDDIVNEAVAHVTGLSERPFSILLPDEVIAIPMDGKMIIQVLVNLLGNAVSHTSEDCRIELSVYKRENYIEFRIADGGSGIDPALEGRLFEAFITSGKTGFDGKKGIGLGLAICKAVVEAHGGSIQTGKSHLGGAQFIFTLPYTEDAI
jgi:two-component system sensor histidine kinase KdpD